MIVGFKDRQFADIPTPELLRFQVLRYSHKAKGGPFKAEIGVTGGWDDLCALVNWLRYEVDIFNDTGALRWWGYVSRVEVSDGDFTLSVDIEEMTNNVAVAFTEVGLGQATSGRRKTTPWVLDSESAEEFGIREILDTKSGLNMGSAQQRQALLLARQKHPKAAVTIRQSGRAKKQLSAKLYCNGWWETLSWRYANVPTQVALQYTTAATSIPFGDNDVQKLAQAFDTGATPITVVEIEVPLVAVGHPADDVKIAIHENPDDSTPGTELSSVTLSGVTLFTTGGGWQRLQLPAPLALSANKSYFLVLSRTSSLAFFDKYETPFDGLEGYGAGPMIYNNGGWLPFPGDMNFRLYQTTLVETSQQIKALITAFGQFLRKLTVEVASGVFTESYRNGDSDTLFEVDELLEMGTTNSVRMLAEVDAWRNVRIFEEPEANADLYYLDRAGYFYRGSQQIAPDACPVGFWAKLRDVIPATVDTAQLSGIDTFFVEKSEYDAVTGQLTFEPYGERDPFDFGVQNG